MFEMEQSEVSSVQHILKPVTCWSDLVMMLVFSGRGLTGGPSQNFLTLLMKHLKERPIFDGPVGRWFLDYNANDMHIVRCVAY